MDEVQSTREYKQKRIPSGMRGFIFSKIFQTGSGAHPVSFAVCNWDLKLTFYLHLMPRLKMNEGVPPLSLYVFVA
jgi:hypothetical protein